MKDKEQLIPGEWGFIDISGKMVIPPVFDGMEGAWDNGLAIVKQNGLWGLIDRHGNFLIKPRLRELRPAGHDLFIIEINEKEGVINRDAKNVIATEFNSISPFHDGIAIVEMNGKKGYMDSNGNWVIKPLFDTAKPFSDGLAYVQLENKGGYINKNGVFVIDRTFEIAKNFIDGFAFVETGNKWGLINKQGEFVIEPLFDYVWRDMGGISEVQIDGKYGYIKQAGGEWVIEPGKFDRVLEFRDGLAVVEKDGKNGYADKSGNLVIEPRFSNATSFSNGVALVELEVGKWGIIDKAGKIINVCSGITEIKTGYTEGRAFVRTEKDGKWRLMDETGKIIGDSAFNDFTPFDNGLAMVQPEAPIELVVNTFGWECFLDQQDKNEDPLACLSAMSVDASDWYKLTFTPEGEEKEYHIEDFSVESDMLSPWHRRAFHNINAKEFFETEQNCYIGILYGNKCWGEIRIPMLSKEEKFDPKKCAVIIRKFLYPNGTYDRVMMGFAYDGRICDTQIVDSVGKTGEEIWKRSKSKNKAKPLMKLADYTDVGFNKRITQKQKLSFPLVIYKLTEIGKNIDLRELQYRTSDCNWAEKIGKGVVLAVNSHNSHELISYYHQIYRILSNLKPVINCNIAFDASEINILISDGYLIFNDKREQLDETEAYKILDLTCEVASGQQVEWDKHLKPVFIRIMQNSLVVEREDKDREEEGNDKGGFVTSDYLLYKDYLYRLDEGYIDRHILSRAEPGLFDSFTQPEYYSEQKMQQETIKKFLSEKNIKPL